MVQLLPFGYFTLTTITVRTYSAPFPQSVYLKIMFKPHFSDGYKQGIRNCYFHIEYLTDAAKNYPVIHVGSEASWQQDEYDQLKEKGCF
jgi:hypothetical protein